MKWLIDQWQSMGEYFDFRCKNRSRIPLLAWVLMALHFGVLMTVEGQYVPILVTSSWLGIIALSIATKKKTAQ